MDKRDPNVNALQVREFLNPGSTLLRFGIEILVVMMMMLMIMMVMMMIMMMIVMVMVM